MLKQAIRGDVIARAVRRLITGQAGPGLMRRVGSLDLATNPQLASTLKNIARTPGDQNRSLVAEMFRPHKPLPSGPNIVDLNKQFRQGSDQIADIVEKYTTPVPGGYLYQLARQKAANQSMNAPTPLAMLIATKSAAQFKQMLTGAGKSQFLSPSIPSGLPMGRKAAPQPVSGNPSGAPAKAPANKAVNKAAGTEGDKVSLQKVAAVLKAVRPLSQLFQKASPTIRSQIGKIRLPQSLSHLGNLRQQTFGHLPGQLQQAIMNRHVVPQVGGWNKDLGDLHALITRHLGA